jgi:hypothetical protein
VASAKAPAAQLKNTLPRAMFSYEIRSIGAEFRILSPKKSMPIRDFCGGRFPGSQSDLAETVSER